MLDLPTTALGARIASVSQSQATTLGPGIVGLFIQGIEAGMVFSQFATWLSLPGRTEHRFITILTVFITAVGLVQTSISFVSAWRIYVLHPGEPIIQAWTERIHLILTALAATPVQSLFLWRCYHILNRNVYFIIPLISLLLGTVVLAIFDTVGLFWGLYRGAVPSGSHAAWCLLFYSALSSILDLILSCILFYYLTQSKKRVYANHAVQWVSRHMLIIWQSAIPPTLCTIGLFMVYIVSRRLYPGELEMWFPTLQAMIGMLYVLSHFYNINSRPLLAVGEQERPSATYVFPLTVPVLDGTAISASNKTEEHPLAPGPYTDSFGRTDEVTERSDSKTASLPPGGVKIANGWP